MSHEKISLGLCAGEPSGDVLGGAVLARLRALGIDLELHGIGGSEMESYGLESLSRIERLSVMGLIEPISRLPELMKIRRALVSQQLKRSPDIFLGIDSPDFNMPIERRLKLAGIRTVHLVSPSVWAWRPGRMREIKKAVDKMLCLLPFEVEIYQQAGVDAACVGHPLIEDLGKMPSMSQLREQMDLPASGKFLAVLPGSREIEVAQLMPNFFRAMETLQRIYPSLHFLIPVASPACRSQIESMLDKQELNLKLINGRGREVMKASNAVLLASGTASLEAMLLRRPMVIAYRMHFLSWMVLSRMVKTPYVGLPNILAGRLVAPELLQDRASPENLSRAVCTVLESGGQSQISEFDRLADQIGEGFSKRCTDALLSQFKQ